MYSSGIIKSLLNKATFLFFLCSCFTAAAQTNNAQYVDPMIGTGGHGHTFPGATVPFGMVQLSPDTRIDGSWDGCSGYHYSDSVIYGFSHTHLSGTGCSDYGDIVIMPFTGKASIDLNDFKSKFSHSNERASAGYYSVKLDNGVEVELASTTRVGFHKYKFPLTSTGNIAVDLSLRDKTLRSSLDSVSPTRLEGMRQSEAWAKDQHIYFVIEFSVPFHIAISDNPVGLSADGEGGLGRLPIGNKMCLQFDTKKNPEIMLKVGISPVSIEGARKNLNAEKQGWDFEKTRKDAAALWNKELSKIEVTSLDRDKLAIFYTSLYHTMIQPNVAMDVDSMYRGRDNKIHKADGFAYYTVFSLWDTFRAAHPLYTLIDRKRTKDFISTFLVQYQQGGRLPVWELAGNETDCMIGYHSVSVIADAAFKGIVDFSPEIKYNMNIAYEAMKHSATLDHMGLNGFKKHGYVSMDDDNESVSKTLEYAYDDWCIAQIAEQLSKTDDYNYFIKRSQSWKNVFDPQTGFMRPKKNSGWLTPFDPREVNNNFTEANSWQYTFFVPHDIYGLVELMGGAAKFDAKLDEFFTTSSVTTGRSQADITGLVGQYAHGNEPSHHIAYLYNYIGKPWKSQERLHQLQAEFYKNSPDGLIGNEDCGQMSAWYVLSSMGFYQVCPGDPQFEIGSPLFKMVKINLENGKTFAIRANNLSEQNIYVKSATINKAVVKENKFSYVDIFYPDKKKPELVFEMTGTPEKVPDSNLFIADPSYFHNYGNGLYDKEITIVPLIKSDSKVFEDSLKIELATNEKNTKIFYTLEENGHFNSYNLERSRTIREYTKPFYIHKSDTLAAFCSKERLQFNRKVNIVSDVSEAHFYKRPNKWSIHIESKYNSQYTAGGDKGIIDGLKGALNWRKGEWQGYQGQNFSAVLDLLHTQKINYVTSDYLQDTRAWIIFPTKVKYSFSNDGIVFNNECEVLNDIDAANYDVQVKEFSIVLPTSVNARYVKVEAINFGTLPNWHAGAGDEAFIFIDEIEIK